MSDGGHRRTGRAPAASLKDALGRYDIPSFPRVGREVLSMLQDPAVDFRRVVRCLERDPGLVAQVMRTVNAAGFGPRRAIKTLDVAVSMLGLRSLESMVISATVPALLNTTGKKASASQMAGFWATSAQRAFIARAVADRIDPEEAAASYVAALLQDMALPFLLQHRGDEYEPMLAAWRAGEIIDLAAEERARFEWDHQQVAGWICSVWTLPSELHDAIANHHDGEAAPPAVHAVALLAEGQAPLDNELFVASVQSAIDPEGDDAPALIEAAVEEASQLTCVLEQAKLPKPPRRIRALR